MQMAAYDIESRMWAHACKMLEQADRFHRHFFRPTRGVRAQAIWEPPVDIFETGDAYCIVVALPGVEPEQVSIRLSGAELIVTGERALPVKTASSAIHRIEIPIGHFERRIRLPATRLRLGRRELSNGCLILRLQKL